MTTPQATARLEVLAAWQPPRLRGAVGSLAVTAGRLPSWRFRLETLGRSVESEQDWAGPAARRAGGAFLELATVAAAVHAALDESLAALQRMARAADAAQEAAVVGLAAAGLRETRAHETAAALVPDLLTVSSPAGEALDRAAAVSDAARMAEEALTGLPLEGATPPAAFDLLAGAVLPPVPPLPPPVPPGLGPEAAAAWFAALTPPAQRALVAAAPAAVGGLDGAPAWARDRANRTLLDRALRDPGLCRGAATTAREVQRLIAAEESAGRPVQLQLLDLAGDRVVLALGDLDTAHAVAVLVPGIGNTPADDLGRLTGDARDVAAAAADATPGLAVATVVWLGYRTPAGAGIATRVAAWRGGARLADALAGLAASRAAAGAPAARTSVLAHSYGTVVVDEAADRPGTLAADAVVLLGSPGMEEDAASLEAPQVFDAVTGGDVVARLGWFGSATGSAGYGATGLPGDARGGHSDYYDRDGPTLRAIGEVVVGTRAPR